jgi:hypothetical protein
MAYFLTENFSAGIDTRKHPLTAPSGTLRELLNCHVTPGGEIEKRYAFVEAEDVTGTLNKSVMRVGGTLWIVGPGVDTTYGLLDIRYITGPTITATNEMLDWDVYDGRLYYTVLETADDTVTHWYQDAPAAGPPPVPAATSTQVTEGLGRYIRTYKAKMYSCEGPNIFFSAVGDPTIWDTANGGGTGQGFINAASNDAEAIDMQGIEVYYDRLAFFSSRAIQIWNMDTDPANNAQDQTIRSIGVAGRATPRQYGAGDILFLSPSGIRSLQARDSSNAASVSDVGSAIDFDIQQKILDDATGVLTDTRSMLEDLTGRYWMMFNNEIWVLSLFPGPKVSAWSRYAPTFDNFDVNGNGNEPFTPVDLVDSAGYVCVRSLDHKIYVYGGEDRRTYDRTTAVVQTAYMSFDRPANWKQFLGLDFACDQGWNIEVSYQYEENFPLLEPAGFLTHSSYNDQRFALRGYSPTISLKLDTSFQQRSRLANIAIHYNLSKDD